MTELEDHLTSHSVSDHCGDSDSDPYSDFDWRSITSEGPLEKPSRIQTKTVIKVFSSVSQVPSISNYSSYLKCFYCQLFLSTP